MSRPTSEIYLYNPKEACTGNVEVMKLSDYTFQLLCNDPFDEDLSYGTIIEVEKYLTKDGHFQLKKIVQVSEYDRETYWLPTGLNEKELRIVGDKIVAEGGYWEVMMGRVGIVNLPKQSPLNVNEALNILMKEKLLKQLLQGLISYHNTKK